MHVYLAGTEAAGATGEVMCDSIIIKVTTKYIADHPFLFVIRDHRLRAPVFIGRFVGPASTNTSFT
jgi:serine protease inhibitor